MQFINNTTNSMMYITYAINNDCITLPYNTNDYYYFT